MHDFILKFVWLNNVLVIIQNIAKMWIIKILHDFDVQITTLFIVEDKIIDICLRS